MLGALAQGSSEVSTHIVHWGCQPSQGSTRGGSVPKLTRVAVGRIQALGLVELRAYEPYHNTSSKHGTWLLSGPAREKAGESGQDAC